MIILISGASHTGKTYLAQKLLEKYKFPYCSIDHIKMGLIRSGQTSLTPEDDEELTPYLWGIVKEMIKTAVENKQNLIVEGCYIPFDFKKDFDEKYLREIKFLCLVMSEKYIKTHFSDIVGYENIIEKRQGTDISEKQLIDENNLNLQQCKRYNLDYILIDDTYEGDLCTHFTKLIKIT